MVCGFTAPLDKRSVKEQASTDSFGPGSVNRYKPDSFRSQLFSAAQESQQRSAGEAGCHSPTSLPSLALSFLSPSIVLFNCSCSCSLSNLLIYKRNRYRQLKLITVDPALILRHCYSINSIDHYNNPLR